MSATSSSSVDQLRIVILGDSATGKHCYVKRLSNNTFSDDSKRDNECDIISTKIKTNENNEIPIQFINVSGSTYGQNNVMEYFNNIDAYIIMFDLSCELTYDNIANWKSFIDNSNNSNTLPCLLLANKCDIQEDEVSKGILETIEDYSKALGFSCYCKTSNKDNINIQKSIRSLINIIPRATTLSSTLPPVPIENIKQECTVKILVIGDISTGKTALIQRYVKNSFTGNYRSTIGTDIAVKKIKYNDRFIVNLHIWDIAGEERFGSMTHLYYKCAAGCLIVYDVSKPVTLTSGAVRWKVDFDKKVNVDENKPVPCFLIGNKCDLVKEGLSANENLMKEFFRQNQFTRRFETSAKENINITECFSSLVQEIIDHRKDPIERRHSRIIDIQEPKQKKNNKRCCDS